MKKVLFTILFLSLSLFAQNDFGDEDFVKGQDAYDRQDYPTAIKFYEKAASKNNVDAIWSLGFIYDNVQEHKGINANLVEAFKWYKKCADLNDEQCLFNVGNMYHEGHGVKQDYVEAIKWYLKAADKGYIDAYYNLGLMHEEGLGVRKNIPESIKWYQKAADLGDEESLSAVKELSSKLPK